ncbi:Hypothetical predicted protein [Cloeon dipterum]|uniref:CUB domain-containing protein n=1 Tax=Cloeon dipterum TaxID=197152 RepID=A0A8S1D7Y4_9INSE|nr:Hypothetical predicted protein [Cloeon dipterum]
MKTADTLKNEKICDSRGKKPVIKLENKEKSALRLTDGSLFVENDLSDFRCTFDIRPPSRDNVSIAIQTLSLRRDPDTNLCIDYVQFKNLRTMKPTLSPKYCGDLSAFRVATKSDSPFQSYKGDVTVDIHVAGSAPNFGKELKIDIVFTVSKECFRKAEHYSRCGSTSTCIWDGLFSDGMINCPFDGCLDENTCWNSEKAGSVGADNNMYPETNPPFSIAISIFVYTVILFLVFAIGATIVCAIRDGMQQRSTEVPTAPPLEATACPSEDAEEGPPPYYSLFPELFEPAPCIPEATPLVHGTRENV